MVKRKQLTLFIILTIIILPIISNFENTSVATISHFNINNLDMPENYTINDVPYVSQETDTYCTYASHTMVFKYFGVNTSLDEVLFLTGVGYSLAYQTDKPFIAVGVGLSREFGFISSLYNLSQTLLLSPYEESAKEADWDQYWTFVKENISNNKPVITWATVTRLSSLRDFMNIPDPLFKNLKGSHMIVIVGYNESNQTVCYNDPCIGIWGFDEYGTYKWMNITDFKEAVWLAAQTNSQVSPESGYYIGSFTSLSDEPLDKEYIFDQAHKRNIERLKGNKSAYDDDCIFGNVSEKFNGILGINAMDALKDAFKPGFKNRTKTLFHYKHNGLVNHFIRMGMILFRPRIVPIEQCRINTARPYSFLLLDKQYLVNYLKDNAEVISDDGIELSLFEQELENWTEFYEDYNVFIDRGFLMSNLRGRLLIDNMYEKICNIIKIEKIIIGEES